MSSTSLNTIDFDVTVALEVLLSQVVQNERAAEDSKEEETEKKAIEDLDRAKALSGLWSTEALKAQVKIEIMPGDLKEELLREFGPQRNRSSEGSAIKEKVSCSPGGRILPQTPEEVFFDYGTFCQVTNNSVFRFEFVCAAR